MSAGLWMLLVTVLIGFSLVFMVITKKGSLTQAFSLWLIQLIAVLSISMFHLKLSLIDTFTSTFGLLTLLMLILVLSNKKKKKQV
ncbi:hypothetical protein [Ferdinandcohnia sp. Marseille-Q9671]